MLTISSKREAKLKEMNDRWKLHKKRRRASNTGGYWKFRNDDDDFLTVLQREKFLTIVFELIFREPQEINHEEFD